MMNQMATTAAVLCVAALGTLAQGRPDFSGTWELDLPRTQAENRARSGVASGGGGGGMSTMSPGGAPNAGAPAATVVRITQTSASLTIDRVSGQIFAKTNYRLDGGEAVTVIDAMTRKQKSRWEGTKLVSEGTGETVLSDGSGSVKSTFKEVRWLDKDGTMVVESTRAVQPPPGMQLGNGGAPRTTVQYFKKN
ncbi:MAG: hypothetical protein IT185_00080 [Acidobacteria bacterium]|nr:hypothetical protein [Acidobacteriota bacterium]